VDPGEFVTVMARKTDEFKVRSGDCMSNYTLTDTASDLDELSAIPITCSTYTPTIKFLHNFMEDSRETLKTSVSKVDKIIKVPKPLSHLLLIEKQITQVHHVI